MKTTRVSLLVRAGLVAAAAMVAKGLLAQETTQSVTASKALQTSYTLETGVIFQDLRVGTGPEPRRGQMIGIHYEGRVLSTGRMIDNSRIKIIPNPLRISLGGGKLIPGLEDGLIGMRLGGRRLIEIPPDRAYGDAGIPPEIPPKARLLFDVELVEVRDAATTSSVAQE